MSLKALEAQLWSIRSEKAKTMEHDGTVDLFAPSKNEFTLPCSICKNNTKPASFCKNCCYY